MPDATSHIRVICLRAGSDFLHSITLYSEPYTIIRVIWLTSDIHFNECWMHSEHHATWRGLKELIYLSIIPEKKKKSIICKQSFWQWPKFNYHSWPNFQIALGAAKWNSGQVQRVCIYVKEQFCVLFFFPLIVLFLHFRMWTSNCQKRGCWVFYFFFRGWIWIETIINT